MRMYHSPVASYMVVTKTTRIVREWQGRAKPAFMTRNRNQYAPSCSFRITKSKPISRSPGYGVHNMRCINFRRKLEVIEQNFPSSLLRRIFSPSKVHQNILTDTFNLKFISKCKAVTAHGGNTNYYYHRRSRSSGYQQKLLRSPHHPQKIYMTLKTLASHP